MPSHAILQDATNTPPASPQKHKSRDPTVPPSLKLINVKEYVAIGMSDSVVNNNLELLLIKLHDEQQRLLGLVEMVCRRQKQLVMLQNRRECLNRQLHKMDDSLAKVKTVPQIKNFSRAAILKSLNAKVSLWFISIIIQ